MLIPLFYSKVREKSKKGPFLCKSSRLTLCIFKQNKSLVFFSNYLILLNSIGTKIYSLKVTKYDLQNKYLSLFKILKNIYIKHNFTKVFYCFI